MYIRSRLLAATSPSSPTPCLFNCQHEFPLSISEVAYVRDASCGSDIQEINMVGGRGENVFQASVGRPQAKVFNLPINLRAALSLCIQRIS